MPLDPAGAIAGDQLSIAGEPMRLDLKTSFFADLAHDGFDERLTEFDTAAWKSVEALSRRPGASNDQHAAVPEKSRH